ncbi:MAG: DMT family transporter [Steroidobacteraceae bacterium]
MTVAAIGGSAFLFLRVAAPAFGAAPLIESRLAIGALILSPFAWRARRQLAAAGWWKITAVGAVNLLVPFLLFAWSSERAPVGVNVMVFSMSVPFAALGAFALYRERMARRRVVGMLAGLAGVALLASSHLSGVGVGFAVAAGTAAALLFGGSANLVKRQFEGVPAIGLIAAMLASDALLLAPFAIVAWPAHSIPGRAWMDTVALGVLCTGLVYALYFRLIQRIGAPRAAMMAYLVPAFGVLWAWLALGEPLTIDMAAGGALILGGMQFGQLQPRSAAVRSAAPALHERPCAHCGS